MGTPLPARPTIPWSIFRSAQEFKQFNGEVGASPMIVRVNR
jgi:hypothetical protein